MVDTTHLPEHREHVQLELLDVAFNSEFERRVDRQATELMAEDPEIFLTSKLSAGERRVPFTKWVGKAWQETSCRIKDAFFHEMWHCTSYVERKG